MKLHSKAYTLVHQTNNNDFNVGKDKEITVKETSHMCMGTNVAYQYLIKIGL
jgi:hypothetical protein